MLVEYARLFPESRTPIPSTTVYAPIRTPVVNAAGKKVGSNLLALKGERRDSAGNQRNANGGYNTEGLLCEDRRAQCDKDRRGTA
jgi:hypothetical protein